MARPSEVVGNGAHHVYCLMELGHTSIWPADWMLEYFVRLEDLRNSVGHLLRRASQVNNAIFFSFARDADLTPVQFIALKAIDETTGVDVTRLSGLIALDRSTLGAVISRLELKGLVLRAPDKLDKRSKLLYLTPAGKKLMDDTAEQTDSVNDRVLAHLEPADQQELVRILRLLIERSGESMPASVRLTSEQTPKPVVAKAPRKIATTGQRSSAAKKRATT